MQDPNAPGFDQGNAEAMAGENPFPPPGTEFPHGYAFGQQGYYPPYSPYQAQYVPPGYPPPPPGYYGAPPAHAYPPPPFHPYGHMPPAGTANPAASPQNSFADSMNEMADKNGLGMFKDLFNWNDGDFWKGAIVGAAVVMLMTNEELRNSLVNGAAKTAETIKNGFAGGAGASAGQAEGDEGA